MNSIMQKSDEEYNILIQFRKNYPDFPSGKLIKTESPDFIVKVNTKESVGIELTKWHNPTIKHTPRNASIPFNKETLDAIIRKKEEKIPLYKKNRISNLWLIITSENLHQQANFHIHNQIEKWICKSDFQHIFIFDMNDKKVYTLN